MIVLDASVLIAYLDAADAFSGRALSLFEVHAGEPWAMSVLNLAEVLVAPERAGRSADAQAVIAQLGIREVGITAGGAANLASIRARTGLRMPDCCALLAAMDMGAGLATFDDRLADRAQTLGVRLIDAGEQ